MQFDKNSGEIEGHIKIFVHLANKYKRSIIGYEQEDLIQEQIIACYRAIDKFEEGKKLSSFIYAVSENALKGLYRKEQRQKRKPKQLSYLDMADFERINFTLNDDTFAVESNFYLEQIKCNATNVATDVLSRFEMQLYNESILKKKTIYEIAQSLNKSERQITNGLNRMRAKLKKKRKSILNDL